MCNKVGYVTAGRAYKALSSARKSHKKGLGKYVKSIEERVYKCSTCYMWHLTSKR